MEPEQPPRSPEVKTIKPVTGRLSPVFFGLGIVFFFLPFIDIRCNDVSLQQVNGIQLATGFKIKSSQKGSLLSIPDHSNDDFSFTKNSDRQYNIYAFLALLAGVAGLVLSILRFKGREMMGIVTGIGAAAALIGLMADIRSQVKLDLSAKTDDLNIRFAVDFTPWFYITVLVFLTAAVLSFLAIRGKSAAPDG